jgi:hypothetical protein
VGKVQKGQQRSEWNSAWCSFLKLLLLRTMPENFRLHKNYFWLDGRISQKRDTFFG